jgi:hypothetical protein
MPTGPDPCMSALKSRLRLRGCHVEDQLIVAAPPRVTYIVLSDYATVSRKAALQVTRPF